MEPSMINLNTSGTADEQRGSIRPLKRHRKRMRTSLIKLLTSGVIGLILLIPGTYFMLTFLLRVLFGSTGLYHSVAPSFIQTGSEISSFNLSWFIFYGPLLAIILNLPAILQFQLQKSEMKLQLRIFGRHWLNTAIAIQSILLFITLVLYLVIQHCRY